MVKKVLHVHFCLINLCAWQFSKGDAVELRSIVDRSTIVAIGKITGLPGEDRFHCVLIESPWVRVAIKEVLCGDIALPHPIPGEKQVYLRDVRGMNTLWSCRLLRKC